MFGRLFVGCCTCRYTEAILFTAQDLAGSEKQKKTHASGERLQADKPSWIISDHFWSYLLLGKHEQSLESQSNGRRHWFVRLLILIQTSFFTVPISIISPQALTPRFPSAPDPVGRHCHQSVAVVLEPSHPGAKSWEILPHFVDPRNFFRDPMPLGSLGEGLVILLISTYLICCCYLRHLGRRNPAVIETQFQHVPTSFGRQGQLSGMTAMTRIILCSDFGVPEVLKHLKWL